MATPIKTVAGVGERRRAYPDLHEHLATLNAAGLLRTIAEPVNKDTEMHPLVRWQYRGGIPEKDRKAFLFTNITDSRGRHFDIPVVVGALAATPAIYAIGMGVALEDVGRTWSRAIAHPLPPRIVAEAPCHEIVLTGPALEGEGQGLEALPIPISSPGFDAAPFLTATNCITRDPETGVQNMGTYRGQIKAPRRLGIKMFVSLRAGGLTHWRKYKALGEKMPMAVVVGCPPAVAYLGPQKLAEGQDEIGVAGGIVGAPIDVVRAKTVDLFVPADSEVVIEGLIDTEYLEPEGPFGESHGHVNLEEYNHILEVTAITRKRAPIIASIISQVTPSESSVIKRVAYEPMFLNHLRDHLGIKGVKRVSLHEPLTNLRKVVIVVFDRSVPTTEIWRGLYAAASFQGPIGKYVIAVNEDIDPDSADAVFWALAYRSNPALDTQILPHRERGHGPRSARGETEDAALLVDATLKGDMPPVSLPTRPFMEHAKALWERLGLPALRPESPWHGYELGDWSEEAEEAARRAVRGEWGETARRQAQRRRKNIEPNTLTRDVKDESGT